MTAKTIAGIIPSMMSLSLVGENIKYINKKKKTTKDMLNLGFTNVVGASMIGATSKFISDM